jgi:hypothetical protein
MEPAIWSDSMTDDVKPKKKRRNIVTINRLIKVLEEGNMNTSNLYYTLKERWPRTAPSMTRLSNLLKRSKEFKEVGEERVIDETGYGQNYDVRLWGLANEAGLDN